MILLFTYVGKEFDRFRLSEALAVHFAKYWRLIGVFVQSERHSEASHFEEKQIEDEDCCCQGCRRVMNASACRNHATLTVVSVRRVYYGRA